jgi:flagellar M-ring protein FliF
MANATEARLSNITDFERAFATRLERQAREYFLMFDGINLISHPRFDWDEVTEHMVRHFASQGSEAGFVVSEHIIRETMENVAAGAPIGMEANDLMTYLAGGGGSSSSAYNESTRQFIFDTVVSETIRNPGRFLSEDANIAATAYIERQHFRQDLIDDEFIEDTGTAWRQYQASVGNYEFISAVNPDRHAAYQRLADNFASVFGVNSFLIEVIEVNEFIDIQPSPPLDWLLITILTLLFLFIILLTYGLIRRAQPDEIEEIEEPLTVEDMLATTKREEEIERQIEAEKLRAIEMGGDSAAKKAIEKFVDDRPEAVAGLLRNWLNEEWE